MRVFVSQDLRRRGALGALLLSFTAATLFLSGCRPVRSDERAFVIDPQLRGALQIQSWDPKWNEAGQLEARALIRNYTSDPLHLMVQIVFLDSDEAPLQGNPAWENIIVPQYGQISHKRVAIDQTAVDYRVQVRAGVRH